MILNLLGIKVDYGGDEIAGQAADGLHMMGESEQKRASVTVIDSERSEHRSQRHLPSHRARTAHAATAASSSTSTHVMAMQDPFPHSTQKDAEGPNTENRTDKSPKSFVVAIAPSRRRLTAHEPQ